MTRLNTFRSSIVHQCLSSHSLKDRSLESKVPGADVDVLELSFTMKRQPGQNVLASSRYTHPLISPPSRQMLHGITLCKYAL